MFELRFACLCVAFGDLVVVWSFILVGCVNCCLIDCWLFGMLMFVVGNSVA